MSLEKVECELRGVGCGGRFLREDQEEHARQNSQKHLTLTASLVVETKEQLQQKLLELDQRHKEEEEKLKVKMEEQLEEQQKSSREQVKKLGKQVKKLGKQEKKLGELGEQEKKLGEQEKKLGELEKKLGEQEKKLGELEKKLGEQEKKLGEQEKMLGRQLKLYQKEKMAREKLEEELCIQTEIRSRSYKIRPDFLLSPSSEQKVRDKKLQHRAKKKDQFSNWKSPAMYTHLGGYKFCIGVDANGYSSGRGKSIHTDLCLCQESLMSG